MEQSLHNVLVYLFESTNHLCKKINDRRWIPFFFVGDVFAVVSTQVYTFGGSKNTS